MVMFEPGTRSMPATLLRYATLISEDRVIFDRAHIGRLLARVAREDLRSMSLDQFELTTQLEGYPFEHYLDDPATELQFRIDRNNFNVSVAEGAAWDSDVYLPDFDPRNGVEWHVIEGKRTLVFAADRFRTLREIIGRLSTLQGFKCLLAVEHCHDQASYFLSNRDRKQVYHRRRREIFHQMQNDSLEGWLDAWAVTDQ